MKKEKQTTDGKTTSNKTGNDKVNDDKSDKVDKRYQLFPRCLEEVLPDESLTQLGTVNLSRLETELRHVINVLDGKDADSEVNWWRLCVYDNGDDGAIATLRFYHYRVMRMLCELQDDRRRQGKLKVPEMPLLPCLRTPEWAQKIKDDHKRLLAYIAWAEAGVPRRLAPYKTRIAEIIPTGISPLGLPTADLRLQLLTNFAEEHRLLKDFGELSKCGLMMCDSTEYDLRSQFLLTLKEAVYFRHKPEQLRLWTELCDGGDPAWSLSSEMKDLWQSRFGNRRPTT